MPVRQALSHYDMASSTENRWCSQALAGQR